MQFIDSPSPQSWLPFWIGLLGTWDCGWDFGLLIMKGDIIKSIWPFDGNLVLIKRIKIKTIFPKLTQK